MSPELILESDTGKIYAIFKSGDSFCNVSGYDLHSNSWDSKSKLFDSKSKALLNLYKNHPYNEFQKRSD